jgi:hypothetical protein
MVGERAADDRRVSEAAHLEAMPFMPPGRGGDPVKVLL